MATKTITLTGAEVAVTGLDGAHAHIRNDGTEVIYAAKTAGITAGADGVASIPAGQSDTIRGISGAVYLLGTGSVLIQSDDYVASPFKTSAASGGSAVDEVARAAINAHSGNAEIHVTAEEKAAWNAVNYSNPNLLINPDFRINQRGKTAYNSEGYTVDRWHLIRLSSYQQVTIGTVTPYDGGVELTSGGSKFDTYFRQYLENAGLLTGKTVTLSLEVEDISGSWIIGQFGFAGIPISDAGIKQYSFEWNEHSTPAIQIYCGVESVSSIKTKWINLELGSIATPFVPPDPATELAKCQRYYQIHSTGNIAAVDLRPTMRDTPTITQLSDGNYAYSAEL